MRPPCRPASRLTSRSARETWRCCKSTRPRHCPRLRPRRRTPTDGSNLITTGYPASVTSAVDLSNLQPTLTPGQVTSIQTYNGAQVHRDQLHPVTWYVRRPDRWTLRAASLGRTASSRAAKSQQLNFITSTSEVRRVLADNSVSPKLTAADHAWRTGLGDYYAGKYREAVQQLNLVLSAIPGDRSAQQFKAKAIADYPLESTGPAGLAADPDRSHNHGSDRRRRPDRAAEAPPHSCHHDRSGSDTAAQ